MQVIRTRMSGAGEGAVGEDALQWAAGAGAASSVGAAATAEQGGGPIAREFRTAAAGTGNGMPPSASSMADTLREVFALNEGGAAPAHVRQAYGRLSAMGL